MPPITYSSSTLRQVLPRVEIRARDRRSGAFPTKAKTGDRTRTGKNNVYFDDAKTVLFRTGTLVSYPTTFQYVQGQIAEDLTSSLGNVTGNVDPYSVDQFVTHHDQSERPGPFFDNGLFEQDETNVVNSSFMTGAAYSIAPDKFKSKVSNKTAIRMEFALKTESALSVDSSSIHYLNPSLGRFEKVADERSRQVNLGSNPANFSPVLFTPYGSHFLPLNNLLTNGFGGGVPAPPAQIGYRRITTYAGDGGDAPFFDPNVGFQDVPVTASLLNPRHAGDVTQSIDMSSYLSHPFLLEKIAVEFPFKAGPGWLNDRFGIREALVSDLQYVIDGGGPMVTFALLRRDSTDGSLRDLIASGTVTTRQDMVTGSYQVTTSTYSGSGGYSDIVITPEGVGYFINPSVVISGSTVSGSNNFFTGSVKLLMDPQITSHVWRQRVSGSATFFFNVKTTDGGPARTTQANGIAFGPISRRSSKFIESSRNILGNQFALIDSNALDGALHPVAAMDSQYEDGEQDSVAPRFFKSKAYYDVVSKTAKSPFLLYPGDRLVFAISKHRSVGIDNTAYWDFTTDPNVPAPTRLNAYHDVAIPTGSVKITLYGDLVKEDREFHDTLNQRLETVELWQDVGEDPVLDQFDVTYRNELSGTYLDRFNVLNTLNRSYNQTNTKLTASLETLQYYSNFSDQVTFPTSSLSFSGWGQAKAPYELAKSNKNLNLVCDNEIYWDCRFPIVRDILLFDNPLFRIIHPGNTFGNKMNLIFASGTTGDEVVHATSSDTGFGVKEWFMSFPYEPKYANIDTTFVLSSRDQYTGKQAGSTAPIGLEFNYTDVAFAFGDAPNRAVMVGSDGLVDGEYSGCPRHEFLMYFFGIGNGSGIFTNNHVRGKKIVITNGVAGSAQSLAGAEVRGWKYGMISPFQNKTMVVYRRDRYGQPRDLLEQRLDAKFFDDVGLSADGNLNGLVGVKSGPVQVKFFDSRGNQTDALKTLSSNVSFEATSSVPYVDGIARNRSEYDFSSLNIKNVVV